MARVVRSAAAPAVLSQEYSFGQRLPKAHTALAVQKHAPRSAVRRVAAVTRMSSISSRCIAG